MDGNNEKFSSINDLYRRILPALEAKVSELKRENIRFVTSKDIWNYCIETKWKNKSDLRIYEIVSDILNTDGIKLESYVRQNIINYRNLIDRDETNER